MLLQTSSTPLVTPRCSLEHVRLTRKILGLSVLLCMMKTVSLAVNPFFIDLNSPLSPLAFPSAETFSPLIRKVFGQGTADRRNRDENNRGGERRLQSSEFDVSGTGV